MMKRLVIILGMLTMATGCVAPAYQIASQHADTIAAEVDETMDALYNTLCSERFSKRAYQDFLERRSMTAEELSSFCRWDVPRENVL